MKQWRAWRVGCVLLGWALVGCQPSGQSNVTRSEEAMELMPPTPDYPHPDSIAHLSGEQLAYRYCQTCHTFPKPDLLPKSAWTEGVLPRMGHRLGIRTTPSDPYQGLSMYDSYILREAAVFPDEPQISEDGWRKIVRYYQEHAPDSLHLSNGSTIVDTTLALFRRQSVRLPGVILPITTLLHYDSLSHHLFVGDARGRLYEIRSDQTIRDSLTLDSPPAHFSVQPDGRQQVLTMGIMNPSDRVLGKLWQRTPEGDTTRLLPDMLRRPVHFTAADLNQDGQEDWIVSEFGNHLGELVWYEGTEDHSFRKHVLASLPGARRTEVIDLNRDERPDIVALLAQGDERIVVFYNQGNGRFRPQTLLRFPPVYGSSYFELTDFNQDGQVDILYTNGDNADYSPVLKPYHGIRIFLQQADQHFEESFFFPLPGAAQAMAQDFDQDGDTDIAAISFFPDFEQAPEQGFVYLENQSSDTELRFRAGTFPEATHGHWLAMDTGDIDQDGDTDIILGSFALPPSQALEELKAYWAQYGPSYMILENQLKEGNELTLQPSP